RESLFWVNVKAIPAMEKDQKNENTLQLAIISRIKMFYRPTNLAMAPEEAPAMLRFRRSGSKLTLINPTPYFITVTNMKAGNSNLPNTMVPPKGEVSVDIPHAASGDISFQTINDYGALTPRIKATMQ
ncbi:fimbria/pilus periplasmic chaperone, partial [Klebsiella pneumoniae]